MSQDKTQTRDKMQLCSSAYELVALVEGPSEAAKYEQLEV